MIFLTVDPRPVFLLYNLNVKTDIGKKIGPWWLPKKINDKDPSRSLMIQNLGWMLENYVLFIHIWNYLGSSNCIACKFDKMCVMTMNVLYLAEYNFWNSQVYN